MITPSQRAIDFLWSQEADMPYQAISWPGGASGVTLGGFYDCGQQSALRIAKDWSCLPDITISRLMSYAGTSGAAAQRLALSAQDIDIDLEIAKKVFAIVVDRYADITRKAFDNCELLSGDSFGALVSLVFNRGADMIDTPNGSNNRLEMRQIRDAMSAQNFDLVPGFILAMQRLWPINSDLWRRRAEEADLFTSGLHPSLIS